MNKYEKNHKYTSFVLHNTVYLKKKCYLIKLYMTILGTENVIQIYIFDSTCIIIHNFKYFWEDYKMYSGAKN